MKTISNEEYAIELAENISPYDIGGDNAAHYAAKDAALDALEWKDEQHKQEKQQWIDDTVDWLKNSTYGYLKEEGGDVVLDREALANDYALYKKKQIGL
jgi:hypothetical protein